MVKICHYFDFESTYFWISMGEAKKMTTFFLIFFTHLGFTQNLTGDWLNVKKHNVLTDPNIHIIQASENSLIHRDFDKKLFTERYDVKGNLVFCNDTLRYRIDEHDSQLMTLGYINEVTGENVFKTIEVSS